MGILGEVVVTAERREVSIQRAPQSVTAFDDEAIRAMRIQDVTDLQRATPGLVLKRTGPQSDLMLSVRGIGMNNTDINDNPAVTVYLDEIALPSIAMLGFQLYDLERIEVLKGPQGTLYGRNTTGGAVNLITKRPTQEFSFDGRLDIGSLNRREVEAGIGGGLTDTLSARVAVNAFSRDGWQYLRLGPDHGDVDSRNGDIDTKAVRASLLWEPTESFDALLVLDYSRSDSETAAYSHNGNLLNDGTRARCSYPTTGIRNESQCASYAIPRDAVGGTPTSGLVMFSDSGNVRSVPGSFIYGNDNDVETGGAMLKLNANFGATTLTTVSAYRDYSRQAGGDDGSPYLLSDNYRDQDITLFSQEVRLASDDSWDRVEWVVGAYFTRDEVNEWMLFNQRDQFAYSSEFYSAFEQTTEAIAGFGQLGWRFSDSWKGTIGARYTSEERLFAYGGSAYGSGAFPTPVTGYRERIETDQVTGKLGLEYLLNSDVMLYGSVSTGFKAGGFPAAIAFDTNDLLPFEKEKVTAYEFGLKSTLWDRRLRLNASGYYYKWADFQATTQVIRNDVPIVILASAGDTDIKGVELELTFMPYPSLIAAIGINWMDAEIQNGRYAGQQPPNAPEYTLNSLVRFTPDIAWGEMHPYFQADYSYNAELFSALANTPAVHERSVSLINGRMGVQTDNGFDIAFWVKNAADKLYRTSILGAGSSSLPGRALYGDPRTYGLSVSYSYR